MVVSKRFTHLHKHASRLCYVLVAISAAAAIGFCLAQPGKAFANDTSASAAENSMDAYLSLNAEKPMNKLGLKWDLKNGKTYKAKVMATPALGMKQYGTIGIKNFKKKKKSGSKTKVTFTYEINRTLSFNKANVDKYIKWFENNMEKWRRGPDDTMVYHTIYFSVVDKDSGLSLESGPKAEELGVKFKSSWKYKGTQTFKGSNGRWLKFPKKSTCKVTITMPSDYKGLCIGIGTTGKYLNKEFYFFTGGYGAGDGVGVGYAGIGERNNEFWGGSCHFTKTTFYKARSESHWMQVK